MSNIDQSCEDILKSWFIQREDTKHPLYVLHIFAENSPAQRNNSFMLKNIPNKLLSIPAKDEIPEYFSNSDVSEVLNRKKS